MNTRLGYVTGGTFAVIGAAFSFGSVVVSDPKFESLFLVFAFILLTSAIVLGVLTTLLDRAVAYIVANRPSDSETQVVKGSVKF